MSLHFFKSELSEKSFSHSDSNSQNTSPSLTRDSGKRGDRSFRFRPGQCHSHKIDPFTKKGPDPFQDQALVGFAIMPSTL